MASRRLTSTHPCPGKCARQVPHTHFACSACWGRLPRSLQEPITATFGVDQGAHLAAMAAACDWFRQNPRPMPIEERCELTELLIDQCGCPAHRGGVDPDEQLIQQRAALLAKPGWVAARFASVCRCCGEGFPAGTAIRAVTTGGWRAECCADEGEVRSG